MDYIIKQALDDLFKYAREESDLTIDLGLNKWGQGKLGLLVEMYLQKEGCRALTDEEITSWQTIGDVTATVQKIKKERKKGSKKKLPAA